MRLTVFLVCLCVLLLKGYNYAYTDTHQSNTSAHHTEGTQLVKVKLANQDYSLIQDTMPDDEDEYLIGEDAEDDETDSFFARKYRLLFNAQLINSHPVILQYLHDYAKAPLNFGCLSSYKYITQQVLRI
ncbi:hypothetical protein GO495_23390 [Chitinophaga oryziterrae]|uniref:Uncharacterized protein n=1 Tax=Chitinophaga oryziterrae TaxID=1031224 RepID=A0A6N8JGD1_9BACT|nr:hypothetical protein [Chitinophaga oryziterrae]MVT43561.1 hypothetical protein [Chitinophaga oryziterrae]